MHAYKSIGTLMSYGCSADANGAHCGVRACVGPCALRVPYGVRQESRCEASSRCDVRSPGAENLFRAIERHYHASAGSLSLARVRGCA